MDETDSKRAKVNEEPSLLKSLGQNQNLLVPNQSNSSPFASQILQAALNQNNNQSSQGLTESALISKFSKKFLPNFSNKTSLPDSLPLLQQLHHLQRKNEEHNNLSLPVTIATQSSLQDKSPETVEPKEGLLTTKEESSSSSPKDKAFDYGAKILEAIEAQAVQNQAFQQNILSMIETISTKIDNHFMILKGSQSQENGLDYGSREDET